MSEENKIPQIGDILYIHTDDSFEKYFSNAPQNTNDEIPSAIIVQKEDIEVSSDTKIVYVTGTLLEDCGANLSSGKRFCLEYKYIKPTNYEKLISKVEETSKEEEKPKVGDPVFIWKINNDYYFSNVPQNDADHIIGETIKAKYNFYTTILYVTAKITRSGYGDHIKGDHICFPYKYVKQNKEIKQIKDKEYKFLDI
jgi:hypothetical protein